MALFPVEGRTHWKMVRGIASFIGRVYIEVAHGHKRVIGRSLTDALEHEHGALDARGLRNMGQMHGIELIDVGDGRDTGPALAITTRIKGMQLVADQHTELGLLPGQLTWARPRHVHRRGDILGWLGRCHSPSITYSTNAWDKQTYVSTDVSLHSRGLLPRVFPIARAHPADAVQDGQVRQWTCVYACYSFP